MKDSPFGSVSHFGREPAEKHYSIFATPDGDKCAEKTKVMLVRGLAVGSYAALFEMIAISKPTTPWAMAARFSNICFPVASMFATYPAIVCVSHEIRKKDDCINHFIAGFVSGTILGARMRSQAMAYGAGFAIGMLGVANKVVKEAGLKWTPEREYRAIGSFDHYRRSFIPGQKYRQLEASDTLDHTSS